LYNVCILTSVHYHDDNRVYYKEVFSLKRFGYNVTYIAPGLKNEIRDGIKYVNVEKPASVLKRILRFYKIYKLAKKQKCDVYHFQDAELIPTGLLLKWFTKAKVIYDVHEDYPSQMLTKYYIKSFLRKPLYKLMIFLEKVADKYFDAIVVADNFVYKHFSPDKTIILYNFPDIRLMNNVIADIKDTEKKYDIIFPGSMAKFTAEMILQTMKVAKSRGYELKCVLISTFKFEGGQSWVEQRIKELGLSRENFLLLNRIPPYDVPKYIKATRVGLIPLPDTLKMRSNIPTKLFEYMYCGIPVITGDLPPSAQFIRKQECGYLVNPNSPEEYADKIIELINNENKAKRMGEIGKVLVETIYNWENEEKKLKNLYESLLKKVDK